MKQDYTGQINPSNESYTKDEYVKVLNFYKHVFHKTKDPNLVGSVGISLSKIKQIIRMGKVYFKVVIPNHPNGEFIGRIKIDDFLKNSIEVYFKGQKNSDKQRVCRLSFFEKIKWI